MKINLLAAPIFSPPYCWLIEMGRQKLGVHKNDGWCIQLDDRIIFFSSENQCMPLGPILELEEIKLFDFLESAAAANPDYSEAIRKFPKELLLKHIFHTSFAGYWPERALEWLMADEKLQLSFKGELESFVQNKAMPQSARQKAKQVVKKLA